MKFIGGPVDPVELMRILGGEAEQENGPQFLPGDISALSERFVERGRRNSFQPGDYVRYRAPEMLGIHNPGPFIVIKVFAEPISVHDQTSVWVDRIFSSAEVDMLIGGIFRHESKHGLYREIYAWSGLLERYELNADELELEKIGINEASNPGKPLHQEDVSGGKASVKQKRDADDDVSPWGRD